MAATRPAAPNNHRAIPAAAARRANRGLHRVAVQTSRTTISTTIGTTQVAVRVHQERRHQPRRVDQIGPGEGVGGPPTTIPGVEGEVGSRHQDPPQGQGREQENLGRPVATASVRAGACPRRGPLPAAWARDSAPAGSHRHTTRGNGAARPPSDHNRGGASVHPGRHAAKARRSPARATNHRGADKSRPPAGSNASPPPTRAAIPGSAGNRWWSLR